MAPVKSSPTNQHPVCGKSAITSNEPTSLWETRPNLGWSPENKPINQKPKLVININMLITSFGFWLIGLFSGDHPKLGRVSHRLVGSLDVMALLPQTGCWFVVRCVGVKIEMLHCRERDEEDQDIRKYQRKANSRQTKLNVLTSLRRPYVSAM